MRVSVVIPAYNEEATVHRTLDSLQKQDYRGPVEIIVVDNGSTDETARVARSWKATVVREPRKGYVFALMKGFEHASGELVLTTDADTIVPSRWISTLVAAFERDPGLAAAGGGVEFCDANWKGKLFERLILPVALGYDRLCFSYPHLWGANLAVRRESFVRAGGWTGKFNLHADADLSRRMAAVGGVAMLPGLNVSTSARRFNSSLLLNLLVYGGNFLGLQLFRRPLFFNFPDARIPLPVRASGRPAYGLRRYLILGAMSLAVALLVFSGHSHSWSADRPPETYIKHIQTSEKVVALTFDDGPNEPYTSQVLQVLRDSDVRATFFLIGENVAVYRDAARKILAEGHVLGNHSYSHPLLLAVQTSNYQQRELESNEQLIEAVTGAHCTLFRPPRGLYTPWLLRTAARHGFTTVGWSEDASDWNQVPSAQIADRIIRNARPGNIILLHDGLNLTHGADRNQTVQALPVIIRSLKDEGYRFVTVPELLSMARTSGMF